MLWIHKTNDINLFDSPAHSPKINTLSQKISYSQFDAWVRFVHPVFKKKQLKIKFTTLWDKFKRYFNIKI
jgi:hypothetical protein